MTLVAVQWLRAAAALMVAWYHARHEAGLLAARGVGAAPDPATLLPWWGGVDLFFVISGFVIVHASRDLFGAPGGRARFLAHRVARVVPLYWLVTLAYLALALARPSLLGEAGALARDPGYVAAAFLFLPAARPDGTVLPLYGLGWTLNCEAFFYALFALGLGLGRRGAVAWLWGALALLVAAGSLARLPLPFAFWADPIVLEFALGATLALARADGVRLGPASRLGLAGLGGLGLALAAQILPEAEASGFARPLCVGLPAALLVAAAALGPARDRAGIAALPAPLRWLSALGDASYALYLVHPFALRAVREGLLAAGLAPVLHPYPWGSMLLMLAGSAAAALLVHRWVERPMTRAARARLDRGAQNRGAQNDVRAAAGPVPRGPAER
ncbi:acyltransferase [Methylobacterium sp. NEAU 140]|uniref:acyltransferase family protein n=1 Tax=Methylobacterium sp. NEAU 140 TaxID=3064945 RepID=UPI002733D596|nr:acyltransferase [Methylobacterium sp. NEAU 140]MDP4024305.1 acyltransferase [Methylobacterium sp. NEAU 140]